MLHQKKFTKVLFLFCISEKKNATTIAMVIAKLQNA